MSKRILAAVIGLGMMLGFSAYAYAASLIPPATSGLYWDDVNKRMGIGTISPAYPLDIISLSGPAFKVRRDNTDTVNQLTGFSAANDDQTPGNGIGVSLISMDSLGNPYAGAVLGAQFISHTSGSAATDMIFKVTNQALSGTPIEYMRITSDGNVGIGTNTPAEKLEVNGGVALYTTDPRPVCDANSRGTFWFTQNDAAGDSADVCARVGGAYAWRKLF